ncbi:hypothetical protein [Salinisphaera hydrothermalis]|uniref:hypothetical protein n=1 Tax=Salinisphaera hydrothermalis TaxID=563188 RepID=UPI0033423BE8
MISFALEEFHAVALPTHEFSGCARAASEPTCLADMGAVIFRTGTGVLYEPATVDDIIHKNVARTPDLFGIKAPRLTCWGEGAARANPPGVL